MIAQTGFADQRAALGSLFAPAYWPNARELVARFGTFVSSLYLECRLGGEASAQADILLAVASASADGLERALRSHAPASAHPAHFCARWNDRTSPLYRAVSAVWLEYDQVQSGARAPSLSACLVSGYGTSAGDPCGRAPSETLALVIEAVQAIRGRPVSSRERARLDRVVTALPRGGAPIHLSYMSARGPANLKLYTLVPRAYFLDYLSAIGWHGPEDDMHALLDEFCPEARVGDQLYVDLTLDDIDAPGGNRIGLVFAPQHLECSRERDPGRRPLLDLLVARGLCTGAQREELVAWPSRATTRSGRESTTTERWLDLKLVWRPDGPLRAKAYLGYTARPALPFD